MVVRYSRISLIVLVALVLALTTNDWSTPTGVRAIEQDYTLSASKDNTLYESATGSLSNGAGNYFFVGRTGQLSNSIRRGVIAFDVAGAVPAGSTILSATLTLQMTRTPLDIPRTVELRRLLSDWGEGTTNDRGGEGSGAPSTPGSATWIHTFFSGSTWSNVGGDSSVTLSASQSVASNGSYSWSSTQMASDVQDWLDNPSNNFGWLLLGDETVIRTAKRFNSRENGIAPPVLSLKASEPPDTDLDGCADVQEAGASASAGGQRDPNYFWDFFDVWTGAPAARDTIVSISDIGAVVARFGAFREPPPTKQEALAEALTPPAAAPAYHTAFDRGGPIPGQNLWNLLPPDGSINFGDIDAMVAQFGHSCA